jgi:Fe-S cluster assembly iron-binding protein IscA
MSQPIIVTERAARRITEIAAGEPGTPLLRLSVEGGGCSGFSYRFGLVEAAEPDDLVIEREGARVLIDPARAFRSEEAGGARLRPPLQSRLRARGNGGGFFHAHRQLEHQWCEGAA